MLKAEASKKKQKLNSTNQRYCSEILGSEYNYHDFLQDNHYEFFFKESCALSRILFVLSQSRHASVTETPYFISFEIG